MLLSSNQSVEIYSAMRALNNVNGRIHVRIEQGDNRVLHVAEYEGGDVQVYIGDAVGNSSGGGVESYAHQQDSAKSYGLIIR